MGCYELKELVDDVHLQLILATPIPSNTTPDSVYWRLSENGEFPIKTTTWAAHELDIKNSPSWEYNWIWHLDIMPKLKIFLWQLCHTSLPTRGTLLNRGLQIDLICPLCNVEIEDVDHLFRRCSIAQEVWGLPNEHNWVCINAGTNSINNVQNWLSDLRTSTPLVPLDRVVALLWSTWKVRNNIVFQNEKFNSVATLIRAKKTCAEWRIRHKLTQSI